MGFLFIKISVTLIQVEMIFLAVDVQSSRNFNKHVVFRFLE